MTKPGTLICVNEQNSVTIQHSDETRFDENMGTNLQTYYKHFYIGCLKTQNIILQKKKKKKKKYFYSPSEICLAGTLLQHRLSTVECYCLPSHTVFDQRGTLPAIARDGVTSVRDRLTSSSQQCWLSSHLYTVAYSVGVPSVRHPGSAMGITSRGGFLFLWLF